MSSKITNANLGKVSTASKSKSNKSSTGTAFNDNNIIGNTPALEEAPVVGTKDGYWVNTPDVTNGRKYKATESTGTASLTDQEGNVLYLYVHEIEMSFEIGGSVAQSPRFRQWYPRNFTRPMVNITGQVATEGEYGVLAEFIRTCQRRALRWQDPTPRRMNQITLKIKEGGGVPNLHHDGHTLLGHILKIDRTATRWNNAPEFQFQFVVATATKGIFEIESSDADNNAKKIAQWMQIADVTRKSGFASDNNGPPIVFVTDPDPTTILKDKQGNVTATSNIPISKI